ncbi:hypothetical protein TMUPMC115_0783 [Tetragenococcus muriaticus PMC-11-5]|uniref:Uncharacterized protein n=1 Tax=Tetragenococcus muriaticus PMC-11-5 TaxID=1302649 RepID=A0A091C715_9ENTE|nr:hypothetical protein TMUPMC115_0783 [Tetragenococcus muriaticus PMC-11-5]
MAQLINGRELADNLQEQMRLEVDVLKKPRSLSWVSCFFSRR